MGVGDGGFPYPAIELKIEYLKIFNKKSEFYLFGSRILQEIFIILSKIGQHKEISINFLDLQS